MRSRRPVTAAALATTFALGVATAVCAGTTSSAPAAAAAHIAAHAGPRTGSVVSPGEPIDTTSPVDLRFLSSPDFLNNDVADVRHEPGYKPGNPNSYNASYARSLNTVMDTWKSENATDVLVAGDLVQGHWGIDTKHTGTFGTLTNQVSRQHAVKEAANLYYGAWVDRFRQHGLTPFPAIGDHELGDNPWDDSDWYRRFKRANFGLFKAQFAKDVVAPGHFTDHPSSGQAARTAYATYLSPQVLLVSVDEFTATASHDVAIRLDVAQLKWLDQTLAAAEANGTKWIIVQGHVPVIGPNRQKGSSSLMYEGGTESPFWQTMVEHHVDVYFNGEVHAITSHYQDGITEISHGGIFGWGLTNYLVVEVRGDQMMFTSKEFCHDKITTSTSGLWQTDGRPRLPPASINYYPTPWVGGQMVITSDNQVLERTGTLLPYANSN